jgi:hypothetical protein
MGLNPLPSTRLNGWGPFPSSSAFYPQTRLPMAPLVNVGAAVSPQIDPLVSILNTRDNWTLKINALERQLGQKLPDSSLQAVLALATETVDANKIYIQDANELLKRQAIIAALLTMGAQTQQFHLHLPVSQRPGFVAVQRSLNRELDPHILTAAAKTMEYIVENDSLPALERHSKRLTDLADDYGHFLPLKTVSKELGTREDIILLPTSEPLKEHADKSLQSEPSSEEPPSASKPSTRNSLDTLA